MWPLNGFWYFMTTITYWCYFVSRPTPQKATLDFVALFLNMTYVNVMGSSPVCGVTFSHPKKAKTSVGGSSVSFHCQAVKKIWFGLVWFGLVWPRRFWVGFLISKERFEDYLIIYMGMETNHGEKSKSWWERSLIFMLTRFLFLFIL